MKKGYLVGVEENGGKSTMWIIQRGIVRNPEFSALALIDRKIGRRALINPSWFSV